jgi:hypothetical protein
MYLQPFDADNRKGAFGLSLALILLFWSTSATASPWTLAPDKLAVSANFSFLEAEREYLDDGTLQVFPLRGSLNSSGLTLGFRYGFTDRFELALRTEFKQVSFEADSVILDLVENPDSVTLAEARQRVIDFDTSVTGPSDLHAVARYNLWRGPGVITLEAEAKVPMAYAPPSGTFSTLDVENGVFEVSDDVSLGDAQIDLKPSLLLGYYLNATRTFGRAGIGYKFRSKEPGDQIVIDVKMGQFISQKIIVFAGAKQAHTVTEGESIGNTFVDTNPTQSAAEYTFADVDIRELRLDRDFIQVEGGVIANLGPVEVGMSYGKTVDGKNISATGVLNVFMLASIENVTGSGS